MHKVENFVEHAYLPGSNQFGDKPGDICTDWNDVTWAGLGPVFAYERVDGVWVEGLTNKEWCDMVYRQSSTMTKILSLTDGAKLGRVTCSEAISYAEMEAAVAEWNTTADEDHQVEHMTVFKQRNLDTAACEGDVEVTVKLWPAAKKNAVVVLAETNDVWKVITVSDVGTDEATANVTGATGFAVCMTW